MDFNWHIWLDILLIYIGLILGEDVGQIYIAARDGRPAPRGTLPAGRGGVPAPSRTVGKGGFPALPRPVKMIKTAGKLRGKI